MLEAQPHVAVRTIVASFLFTDLVGFSTGTAADQYAAKANLSAVLRRHLDALKESDYWIKDTGDGALIAFVSSPEHALYMALALGHDYGAGTNDGAGVARLRTGLHVGTVKESIDVEARRNFIGDGINAAKRIMDFALPGQITASRSFFESIANLDVAYAALFQHLGAPDDKHGRAHELYALAPSDSVLDTLRGDLAAEASGAPGVSGSSSAADAMAPAQSSPAVTRRRWPLVAVGFGIVAVGIGIVAVVGWFFAASTREPLPGPLPASSKASAGITAAPSDKDTVAVPKEAASSALESSRSERVPPSAASVAMPPAPVVAVPSPVTDMRTAPRSSESTAAAASSSAAVARPSMRVTPPTSSRCGHIVEKAALGEPLTPDEKRELADTCR